MKTIVFLHGFNCSPTIFNHLKSCLPEHKSVLISYNSNQSIELSYSEIVSQLPEEKFYLVGHSLGGVIGHLICSRNPSRVEKFVSISSPFGGSSSATAAKFLFPHLKILRDLSPGSKPLKEIFKSRIKDHTAIISTAGSLPIILGQNDGVVTIKSQAHVKTEAKCFIDANHFEVVQHPHTVNTILNTFFSN